MAFGRWLERHHASQRELWVGYWKKHTGKASMDWAQSVREALRVGWIDGVRRTLDDKAYVVRFTPRMPTSVWSAVNIRIAEDLFAEGQMLPAGLAVFVNRHRHDKSGDTSSDRPGRLPPTMQRRLRADPAAWAFWQSQPAGYRRSAVHGVLAVKRDENREKRLAQLIAGSAAGRRLGVMAVTPRRG
jgi:uncharacterized protein YdeI (YjbR/CyaY-like superfamily)